MFRKPKRNIRRRENFDENEDNAMDVDTEELEEKPKEAKARTKPDLPGRKTTVLSFAEEFEDADEGEVFQVKKSSQSRKLKRQARNEKEEKERQKKKDGENGVENVHKKKDKIVTTNEVTLKIKNPIAGPIKSSKSYQPILNGREAEAAELGGVSSDEDTLDQTTRHSFSKPDCMKEMLKNGRIPDAAMIHAARKRRQKAREMGDFIPVSEKSSTAKSGKDLNKRLVHQDDNDDGSESEEERVDMSHINMAAVDRKKRQDAFESVQQQDKHGDSGSEDEEESDVWEKQQIKKGVTGTQLSSTGSDSLHLTSTPAVYSIPPDPNSTLPTPISSSIISSLASQGSISSPGEIVSSLRTRLTSLLEVHRRHKLDKQSLQEELQSLRLDMVQLTSASPKLATRFKFYQDMRGYVTDLVECLDEKIPALVNLEQRISSLLEKQATSLIARRRQDVKDQAEEMSPANPSNKILGMGNARAVSEEYTRRVAEREGRRIRRMRAREKKDIGISHGQLGSSHVEGMSSDDEVTEVEVSALRLQRETLESDARILFEDVNEEFSQVPAVLNKFAQWKTFEPDQYGDAYVSLCLTKILGPFVRYNILFWNPLKQPLKSLELERWFQCVLLYGLSAEETEESLRQDPDVMLLPKVVEKVILSKMEVIVKAAYDPMSYSQTVCLVGTITKLMLDYPTLDYDCKILNSLLEAVMEKFRVSVDEDVFIPIYMNDVEMGRTSAFFQRQFASAVKLLGNIVRWHGLLSDAAVIQLAIDSLLNRYLILGLRTFTDPLLAAEKCKMVSSVLPRAWLNPNSGISQLEMFIRQVRQITDRLKNSG